MATFAAWNLNGVSVAQQVEHIPFKDGVLGSNPSWNTRVSGPLGLFIIWGAFFMAVASHGPTGFPIFLILGSHCSCNNCKMILNPLDQFVVTSKINLFSCFDAADSRVINW